MANPRRRWLVAVCVAAAAVALAGWRLLPEAPRVTHDRYDRIRLGMTKAEVEAVIGCAPSSDDEQEEWLLIVPADQQRPYIFEPNRPFTWGPESEMAIWVDKGGRLDVHFHRGRVEDKGFTEVQSAWQVKVRRWLARLRRLVGL